MAGLRRPLSQQSISGVNMTKENTIASGQDADWEIVREACQFYADEEDATREPLDALDRLRNAAPIAKHPKAMAIKRGINWSIDELAVSMQTCFTSYKLEDGSYGYFFDIKQCRAILTDIVEPADKAAASVPHDAVVPDGWQLVPKTSQTAMTYEGYKILREAQEYGGIGGFTVGSMYKSMLKAAPPAPLEAVGTLHNDDDVPTLPNNLVAIRAIYEKDGRQHISYWPDEDNNKGELPLETASAVREKALHEVAHFVWQCSHGGIDMKDMPEKIRALISQPVKS